MYCAIAEWANPSLSGFIGLPKHREQVDTKSGGNSLSMAYAPLWSDTHTHTHTHSHTHTYAHSVTHTHTDTHTHTQTDRHTH